MQAISEEEAEKICEYCGNKLEGEELDYTICQSCYNDEMTEITKDWNQR